MQIYRTNAFASISSDLPESSNEPDPVAPVSNDIQRYFNTNRYPGGILILGNSRYRGTRERKWHAGAR